MQRNAYFDVLIVRLWSEAAWNSRDVAWIDDNYYHFNHCELVNWKFVPGTEGTGNFNLKAMDPRQEHSGMTI